MAWKKSPWFKGFFCMALQKPFLPTKTHERFKLKLDVYYILCVQSKPRTSPVPLKLYFCSQHMIAPHSYHVNLTIYFSAAANAWKVFFTVSVMSKQIPTYDIESDFNWLFVTSNTHLYQPVTNLGSIPWL